MTATTRESIFHPPELPAWIMVALHASRDDDGLFGIDEVWMHCEPCRLEVYYTYVGSHTASRASQITIPNRPSHGRWGHCFLLYLSHQTSLLSFSATILLSSIIREMSRNYNNYIQAFHWKDSIQENRREALFQQGGEARRRQRRRENS